MRLIRKNALHSTMFLLILAIPDKAMFAALTLHSTMFLLILFWYKGHKGTRRASLHSTMFLLIQVST